GQLPHALHPSRLLNAGALERGASPTPSPAATYTAGHAWRCDSSCNYEVVTADYLLPETLRHTGKQRDIFGNRSAGRRNNSPPERAPSALESAELSKRRSHPKERPKGASRRPHPEGAPRQGRVSKDAPRGSSPDMCSGLRRSRIVVVRCRRNP